MLNEVIDVICEVVEIEPDEIKTDSTLRGEVGATSFDLMNIAVAIEEKYGVTVPNAMLPRIKTVGDILSLLENA